MVIICIILQLAQVVASRLILPPLPRLVPLTWLPRTMAILKIWSLPNGFRPSSRHKLHLFLLQSPNSYGLFAIFHPKRRFWLSHFPDNFHQHHMVSKSCILECPKNSQWFFFWVGGGGVEKCQKTVTYGTVFQKWLFSFQFFLYLSVADYYKLGTKKFSKGSTFHYTMLDLSPKCVWS